jgi:membrane protein DedA with SNARE-associated domain
MREKISRISGRDKSLIALAIVSSLLTLGMAFLFPFEAEEYKNWGYVGIGVAVFLASVPVVSPIPAFVATFFAAGHLNPVLLVVISAAGSTLGEYVAFILGDGLDGFIAHRKWHIWLKKLFFKAPFIFLVIWVALPNPIQALGQVFAGSTGYPWWKFGLATLLGNMIWFSLVVWAGDWLLKQGLLGL